MSTEIQSSRLRRSQLTYVPPKPALAGDTDSGIVVEVSDEGQAQITLTNSYLSSEKARLSSQIQPTLWQQRQIRQTRLYSMGGCQRLTDEEQQISSGVVYPQ